MINQKVMGSSRKARSPNKGVNGNNPLNPPMNKANRDLLTIPMLERQPALIAMLRIWFGIGARTPSSPGKASSLWVYPVSWVIVALTLLFGAVESASAKTVLLVTSQFDGNIKEYDAATGAFLRNAATGIGDPLDVVVGADGNLLVCDGQQGSIKRFDRTSGAFLSIFASGVSNGGMTASDGRVYVCLVSNPQVVRSFDANTGAALGDYIPTVGEGNPLPRDVKVYNGRLYVAYWNLGTVEVFDVTTRASLGLLFPAGAGGVATPAAIAFGPDGNLYVAYGFYVNRYHAITGQFLGQFIDTGDRTGLVNTIGIAWGPDGNLYVAIQNTPGVRRYNGKTGAFMDDFVPPGSGNLTAPFHINFEDPPLEPARIIANYSFAGSPVDCSGNSPPMVLEHTTITNGMLCLNGIYEFASELGSHALATIPHLSYDSFTVSLDFFALDFASDNILTGGTSYRWFSLRTRSGNLEVTLNNQNLTYLLPSSSLNIGQWHSVLCSVDASSRKIITVLDGLRLQDIHLSPDFHFDIVGSPSEFIDKQFTFSNFGDASTFHGYVDNLKVWSRALVSSEVDTLLTNPTVNIQQSVSISWQKLPPGFILRWSSSLQGPFEDFTGSVTLEGNQYSACVPVCASAKYFRLVKP